MTQSYNMWKLQVIYEYVRYALCTYIYLYQEKGERTNTKKSIIFISPDKIIGVITFSSFYFRVIWQFLFLLWIYITLAIKK